MILSPLLCGDSTVVETNRVFSASVAVDDAPTVQGPKGIGYGGQASYAVAQGQSAAGQSLG